MGEQRKEKSKRSAVTGSNQHFQVDMTKSWCGRDGWGYLFAVINAYKRL
jgi:putative transposase